MSLTTTNQLTCQEILTKTPNNPGCYLFKDRKGTIIYIGKAQNLQKRVSSYFQNSRDNYFYQQIHSFNTIITNNVKEALILEQNLIKKYQPRFNILLKDSHYYPYLEITGGKNPRYKIVRKVNNNASLFEKKINPFSLNEYFGPFPDGSKAREILQLLARSKLYKLEKTESESDLARIKSACLIHYQKKNLSERMPDLIIVDGGKEQVKAVQLVKEGPINTRS